MRKPADEDVMTALAAAQRMRDHDVDPHHLAQVLLYLNARNRDLEAVLKHIERFLRFGMAEPELAQLQRLVQRLREQEEDGREQGADTPMPL